MEHQLPIELYSPHLYNVATLPREMQKVIFKHYLYILLISGSISGWTQTQIAVATLLGNSLRQTVHTHRASVHQAAKLVAALLRVAGVTAGLTESNGSLLPGL